MQIDVPKEIIVRNKEVLCRKPFGLELHKTEWRDSLTIELSEQKTADLERLAVLFEQDEGRGAKTLARDVRTWIRASTADGGKQAKARKVRHAVSLLVEYIRRFPHHHVYQREQDSEEGVVLCYFVERVTYHPAERHSPEYVRLTLVYEEFGLVRRKCRDLVAADVLAKTAHSMLCDAGLLPETPELRADYEEFGRRFGAIKDGIGQQFLASGYGSSKDIDGNPETKWYERRMDKILLGRNGAASRVILDVYHENDDRETEHEYTPSLYFWRNQFNVSDEGAVEWVGDEDGDEITSDDMEGTDVPVHPFVVVFDIKRHTRMKIHVGNLTDYQYNPDIRKKLVIPPRHAAMIDTLLADEDCQFRDIIVGKSGGIIVICQGPPGTGKTLTSEIYAEHLKRPLYSVQCSQLGCDPETLEDNLMMCLKRGERWGAVVLLDEADVYLQERGRDVNQNAIVGVFLRVLEYFSGVLFLTTNRIDTIDDAILSRCTARVVFDIPPKEDQKRIWQILARQNNIDIPKDQLARIVHQSPMSGRDIKNVIKLCAMLTGGDGSKFTPELIDQIKEFKPAVGGLT